MTENFKDVHEAGGVRTTRGTRVTPQDTPSDTYRAEGTQRESMQQELMDLGVYLTEHPEARKNLKPYRSSRPLKPGVYFNAGTGMVDRIYKPQRVALGARYFRVSGDPDAPVSEVRRRVLEGGG
jgi:hypothetical protein